MAILACGLSTMCGVVWRLLASLCGSSIEQAASSGKESGLTKRIERFNCTLWQRVSRLVQKTLSFSKSLDNHVGAILYFIHHYNTSLPV
jgi:insertion element IS1 protein InsB